MLNIPKGRMWAYIIGADDRLLGCSSMFRQENDTLVPSGFTGDFQVQTWSQEERQTYMVGYAGKKE